MRRGQSAGREALQVRTSESRQFREVLGSLGQFRGSFALHFYSLHPNALGLPLVPLPSIAHLLPLPLGAPLSPCAVKPTKGNALLFYSLHPNATTDILSTHAGCPRDPRREVVCHQVDPRP